MENKQVSKIEDTIYDTKEYHLKLKNTICPDATNSELVLFSEMIKSTGLNPFKKEIWCIVTGKDNYRRVQMMTGINGFYSIANNDARFDGLESIESDKKLKVKVGNIEKEVPEYITCKVYRKDRKFPTVSIAKWAEFAKDLVTQNGKASIWGQMPSVMLSKCAESMALRKAFPQQLNGLYTEEEMPSEYNITPIDVSQTPNQASAIANAPKININEPEVLPPEPETFEYEIYPSRIPVEKKEKVMDYIAELQLKESAQSAYQIIEAEDYLTIISDKELKKLSNFRKVA